MKILKYLDFFGIHFHFYVGNKRKLYTSYGGMISIVCIFCCIGIFLILCLKDLLHKNPITNMSSVSQAGYHKVKFGNEKLWIPWRIVDFNKNFINFTNLLYPQIYVKKGEKNIIGEGFIFKTSFIKYKLCNETDFEQRGKNYYLDVPLNELYCSEIDNIELGGGWNADFLNYMEIDIYICKDGIDYDETNKNCTSYEKLKSNYTNNHSWAFEYFYPIVEFQPTNYLNPVLVIYKNHFYNFSNTLNKEERMYIQEYVLTDDKGLVFNDEFNSSFWGYISSDFDILYSAGDILNGKHSSSKLYSLSIFLDSGKILYTRRYNKVYTIIANVFPIFNAVFFTFDCLTFMVKTIMTEKYLSELFFQRVNDHEKVNVDINKRKSAGFFSNKYRINLSYSKRESKKKVNNYSINDIRQIDRSSDKDDEKENNNNQNINFLNGQNLKEIEENKKDLNFETTSADNKEKVKIIISNNSVEENNKNNFSIKSKKPSKKNNEYNNSKNSSNSNLNKSNLEKVTSKLKKLVSNRKLPSINNSSFLYIDSPKVNNFVDLNNNEKKSKFEEITEKKEKSNKTNMINELTNFEFNNKNATNAGGEVEGEGNDKREEYKNFSHYNFNKNKGLNNSAIVTRFRLKGSLFNIKDYIYSFFVKAVRKEYKYLSKEFGIIFNFLSEIYDISSYLQLYKQFHILSGFLLDNIADIDINHKININDKELFEQIALKNKNVFYFALKEQFINYDK